MKSESLTKTHPVIINPTSYQTKLYARRYVILSIFTLYSMINAFQWIEYSIITNIISEYYGKSPREIDWLSMIYMAVYIPFIVPASWLLNVRGLKECAIIGALLNVLGAWIKCGSLNPNLFWVTMLGQTICAIAQLFVLNIPSKLAATWFGHDEVSTACAIGVFGNQVGVALGFLIPPIVVPHGNTYQIQAGLRNLFYGVAIFSTLVFIMIVTVFKRQPKTPPSAAEYALSVHDAYKGINFKHSLLSMCKSRNFMLLFFTYGIITGNYYAISTLLNQIILRHYPGQEMNVGRIGLTMILTGLLGAIVAGLWLDKTKAFKSTTMIINILSLVFTICFTFTLNNGMLWLVFVNIGFLGFFMNGYLPVGFEFAAEITYPHSAEISSGLLNASAQIFGIIFTIGMGKLMDIRSVFAANLLLCASLLFGILLTILIRSKLRREHINKSHKEALAKSNLENGIGSKVVTSISNNNGKKPSMSKFKQLFYDKKKVGRWNKNASGKNAKSNTENKTSNLSEPLFQLSEDLHGDQNVEKIKGTLELQ